MADRWVESSDLLVDYWDNSKAGSMARMKVGTTVAQMAAWWADSMANSTAESSVDVMGATKAVQTACHSDGRKVDAKVFLTAGRKVVNWDAQRAGLRVRPMVVLRVG